MHASRRAAASAMHGHTARACLCISTQKQLICSGTSSAAFPKQLRQLLPLQRSQQQRRYSSSSNSSHTTATPAPTDPHTNDPAGAAGAAAVAAAATTAVAAARGSMQQRPLRSLIARWLARFNLNLPGNRQHTKRLYGEQHVLAAITRLQSDKVIEPVRFCEQRQQLTAHVAAAAVQQPQHEQLQNQLAQLQHPQQQQQQQQQQHPQQQQRRLGHVLLPPGVSTISWPGHGVFFFWQLGVMHGLTQAYGPDVMQRYSFIGSSSGAVLSVVAACQLNPHSIMQAASSVGQSAGVYGRKLGLFGVWGQLLRDFLQLVLPHDAAERCNGRVMLLTTAMPWLYHVPIRQFGSRDDVINAVIGSAHIPLLMDGSWSAPLVAVGAQGEGLSRSSATGSGNSSSSSSVGGSSGNSSSSSSSADIGSFAVMHPIVANPPALQVGGDAALHTAAGASLAAADGTAAAAAAAATKAASGAENTGLSCSSSAAGSGAFAATKVIDGNFYYTVKGCYRGYAPADASQAALVIEPQQDEQLAGRVQGLGELFTGLRLLTEQQAQELFDAGVGFAERASRGQVVPLHIRRRSSESLG